MPHKDGSARAPPGTPAGPWPSGPVGHSSGATGLSATGGGCGEPGHRGRRLQVGRGGHAGYTAGVDRCQSVLFPDRLDDRIGEDSRPARPGHVWVWSSRETRPFMLWHAAQRNPGRAPFIHHPTHAADLIAFPQVARSRCVEGAEGQPRVADPSRRRFQSGGVSWPSFCSQSAKPETSGPGAVTTSDVPG